MLAEKNFEELMDKIGYRFKNIEYLIEALTHRSFSNENLENVKVDNEKLEFFGDAVLNLIITEYIYKNEKGKNEGELAKMKSKIISEPVFSSIANDLELGSYLFLSNGEIISGGRSRRSILGDAFEALIGAVFKDSDYYTAKEIAMKYLRGKIENLDKIEGIGDFKTILQEMTQRKYKKMPEYKLVRTTGPDHNKIFEVEVSVNERVLGTGRGRSKKEAEKNSANKALNFIKMQDKKEKEGNKKGI